MNIELNQSGSKKQFAFNSEAFSFFKPAACKENNNNNLQN